MPGSPIIVAGAYALLLVALAVLLVINADQRADLAKADAARSLLQSQNAAWSQKMAATDAALAKIKAADSANAKSIAKAEAAAITSEKKFADQAALIAELKFNGSDCDQAAALAKTYLAHRP